MESVCNNEKDIFCNILQLHYKEQQYILLIYVTIRIKYLNIDLKKFFLN